MKVIGIPSWMYTGIIEATGSIRGLERFDSGCEVEIATETDRLSPEDRIGVSGVCLTAQEVGEGWFRAFLGGNG